VGDTEPAGPDQHSSPRFRNIFFVRRRSTLKKGFTGVDTSIPQQFCKYFSTSLVACVLSYLYVLGLLGVVSQMATSLFRNPSRPDLYICARCAFRSSRNSNNAARRWIGTKYLAKVAEAQFAWSEQAMEVKAGKKKSMFKILEERGYIHQTAGSVNLLQVPPTPNFKLISCTVPERTSKKS
jgi:hypothetical protein